MQINFTDIPQIPQLIKDFLNGKVNNLGGKLFSLKAIEKQIELKEKQFSPQKRQLLFSQISKQISHLNLKEKQVLNLQNINQENTFCVTTGHQLNLFTGPVFFIYKILQCIKTCEFLKDNFPNKNFVPIFWLATEDHDFDEINHFNCFNKTYKINAKSGGAVGRIVLEDLSFVQEFQKEHSFAKHFKDVNSLLIKAFKKGMSLTEITQVLVQELFSDYGLLTINGDDSELKKALIPAIKKEVFEQELFIKTQKNRDLLEKNYGKVQVQPREINLFYLDDNRNRIVKNNEFWEVLNTEIKFNKSEITYEIENFPERFSPNSVLRPYYQEEVLPNLAYIGGNAEIMYWFELSEYFAAMQMPFPILIPRQSMVFIDEKLNRKIENSTLNYLDFFSDKEQIINKKLLKNNHIIDKLFLLKQKLIQQFTQLKITAVKCDITFDNMISAEEKRQLKSFDRLEKRLLRAEKIKEIEWIKFVESIFENLHPNANWQERKINFSQFYLEFGENWIDICYNELNVENCTVNIVVIN